MRHTAATHDAQHGVSHFKLSKKYGWIMTSSVAQDYIDRAGVDELEIAQQSYLRQHPELSAPELRRASTDQFETDDTRHTTHDEVEAPSA